MVSGRLFAAHPCQADEWDSGPATERAPGSEWPEMDVRGQCLVLGVQHVVVSKLLGDVR